MRRSSPTALDAAAERLAGWHREWVRAELLRHRVYLPAALSNRVRPVDGMGHGADIGELSPAEVFAAVPSGRLIVLGGAVSGKTVFLLRLAAGNAMPRAANATPSAVNATPRAANAAEATPHAANATLRGANAANAAPTAADATPHAADATPHAADATPHAADATPRAANAAPHAANSSPTVNTDFSATANQCVPIVVPVAGWDARRRDAADWVAARIAVAVDGLGEPGRGGVTPAQRLVAVGRVLPLFDGLQEVAPAVRAAVLERLDAYPGPFVLTAETHAYRQAAAGGRPQASAVIELGQLRIGELDNYRRTAGAAEAAPGDSGARTDDQAGAGREDGNEERTSRQYTSNQLFAVYGPDDPYSPDQARRWFTFLARGLERAHRYDIRWHNVPALVRPAPAAVIGALLAAGAFEVTLWPGYALCERLAPGFPGDLRRAMDVTFDASTFGLGGVASPLAVGGHLRWLALVAVIGALMWVGGTRPGKAKPKRTAGRRIGDRRSAGQGARKGLVWGVYLGGVELLTYWLRWPEDSWRIFDEMLARHGTRLSGGVVVSFLLVLIVVAVAVGAVAGALRRETGAAVEPSVEHPDAGRRTGLRVLLGSVAVFAVLWPPYVLMLELYYEMPSRPGLGVAAVTGAVFGAGAGLLFTATALSWSQFAVARLYLAARGRLPLHLLRFLDDARDRQLLTGADGIYGYRDPAFRDRLVVRG